MDYSNKIIKRVNVKKHERACESKAGRFAVRGDSEDELV